jgi:hypothetical protein
MTYRDQTPQKSQISHSVGEVGLMTCDEAERIADRAIRKARWPIGNIVTIAIIAAFIAVTVLAFVLGRR